MELKEQIEIFESLTVNNNKDIGFLDYIDQSDKRKLFNVYLQNHSVDNIIDISNILYKSDRLELLYSAIRYYVKKVNTGSVILELWKNIYNVNDVESSGYTVKSSIIIWNSDYGQSYANEIISIFDKIPVFLSKLLLKGLCTSYFSFDDRRGKALMHLVEKSRDINSPISSISSFIVARTLRSLPDSLNYLLSNSNIKISNGAWNCILISRPKSISKFILDALDQPDSSGFDKVIPLWVIKSLINKKDTEQSTLADIESGAQNYKLGLELFDLLNKIILDNINTKSNIFNIFFLKENIFSNYLSLGYSAIRMLSGSSKDEVIIKVVTTLENLHQFSKPLKKLNQYFSSVKIETDDNSLHKLLIVISNYWRKNFTDENCLSDRVLRTYVSLINFDLLKHRNLYDNMFNVVANVLKKVAFNLRFHYIRNLSSVLRENYSKDGKFLNSDAKGTPLFESNSYVILNLIPEDISISILKDLDFSQCHFHYSKAFSRRHNYRLMTLFRLVGKDACIDGFKIILNCKKDIKFAQYEGKFLNNLSSLSEKIIETYKKDCTQNSSSTIRWKKAIGMLLCSMLTDKHEFYCKTIEWVLNRFVNDEQIRSVMFDPGPVYRDSCIIEKPLFFVEELSGLCLLEGMFFKLSKKILSKKKLF